MDLYTTLTSVKELVSKMTAGNLHYWSALSRTRSHVLKSWLWV